MQLSMRTSPGIWKKDGCYRRSRLSRKLDVVSAFRMWDCPLGGWVRFRPRSGRSPGRHRVLRRFSLADPLPHATTTIVAQAASLAIIHQTIQNGCDRGQRVLVPRQDGGSISFQFRANLARSKRTPDFHKYPAARLGEAGLSAIGLAVDQFQQVVAEHLLAEKIRQSGDSLLHRANALHHLGTLPHKLKEFFVRSLHHLLHRNTIGLSIDRMQALAVVLPHFHKPSPRKRTNDARDLTLVS